METVDIQVNKEEAVLKLVAFNSRIETVGYSEVPVWAVSDDTVVGMTVAADGKTAVFRALSNGASTVTATLGQFTDTFVVVVVDNVITSIAIELEEVRDIAA